MTELIVLGVFVLFLVAVSVAVRFAVGGLFDAMRYEDEMYEKYCTPAILEHAKRVRIYFEMRKRFDVQKEK